MLRALGFRKADVSLSSDEVAPLILKQAHDFELALQAMDYLLDDRTDEGLHLINDDPNSTIKTLANGVIKFLESTLGFEPEVMKQAGEVLTKAENLSYNDRTKYQKMKLKTSLIFPPGTEYAVTYAEANLLNALIMLLSESMLESAKALYKLRKAYQTLDEVFTIINKHEELQNLTRSNIIPGSTNDSSSSFNQSTSTNTFASVPFPLSSDQINDTQVTNIAEKVRQMKQSRLSGAHIGNTPASNRLRSELGEPEKKAEIHQIKPDSTAQFIDENQATVDEFIVSGANLCFGILQLVLSLIPPAIGKVLSIIGFKGNKEDGLKKIWKATEKRNIHGCIGLLALLVFYDGPFQFTDTDFDIPSSSELINSDSTSSLVTSKKSLELQQTISTKRMVNELKAFQGIGKPTLLHPGEKLEDALLYARALFPHSALWLLQESRMLASRGRPEEALALIETIDRKIEMKQVEALLLFDKIMVLVFLHKYEQVPDEVNKLLAINEWSPGLYTYLSGCCYLELYRMCELGIITNEEQLAKKEYYKKKAEEFISKAPTFTKNGKIMSKQMPFDKFLIRKVEQFEKTAKIHNVGLIDAIGTSPVHELAYFWSGYNRMPKEHLEIAQKCLEYTTGPYAKVPEAENQAMIRCFLQSITTRRLGELSKGQELLDKKVLNNIIILQPENKKESFKYIRHTEDPWLYPTTLYEKALFVWKDQGIVGLEESKEWLRRAQNYADDYELSTRVGMKIKAALDRLEAL